MERHPLLLVFSLFFLELVRGLALVSPGVYWEEMLPNTTMPQIIKDSLPPSGGIESNLNMGRKGLDMKNFKSLTNNEGSLTAAKGYEVLLSYNNEGSLKSTKGYGALLSYNNEGSLKSTKGYEALWSYNNEGSLKSTKGYGALLSYNKEGSLKNTKGYEALLSYNNEGSLKSTKGYGALLSYNNEGSLKNTKGYTALLSYTNKQSLSSTKGYSGLLSYNKGSLEATNGYSGLLSYNTNSLKTNKYLRLLSDAKNNLLASMDGFMGLLSHNQGGNFNDDSIDHIMDHFFFLEKDIYLGNNMSLHFNRSTNKALFLPREVSNTIPFSSNKLQEIMSLLSINPQSNRAYVLSKRIELCEEPTVEEIEKQCVTSLESMVDYVISKIGKNVKALSTMVDKDVKMNFTIEGVTQVATDHEAVVCHKMDYLYGLYFCHRTKTIRAYIVALVGEDGTKMEAISACHKETNAFLESYAINMLKVKPGSTHICHFPEDVVIWVPY